MLTARQREDLDRHITGNYGEDSVPKDEEVAAARLIASWDKDAICSHLLQMQQSIHKAHVSRDRVVELFRKHLEKMFGYVLAMEASIAQRDGGAPYEDLMQRLCDDVRDEIANSYQWE